MIKINSLSKINNNSKVFPTLDFELNPYIVTALVAPNGYGKSTFIKILIGSIFKSQGSIEHTDQLRISYVSEEINNQNEDTVKKIIFKECILSGLNLEDIIVKKYISKLGLLSIFDQKFKNLSKGQKRKVCIARGFINDADFLILDEPFDGLDTLTRDALIDLIVQRKEVNKGTLLSTHLLYNLDSFIDEIILFGKDSAGFFKINDVLENSSSVLKFFNKEEDISVNSIENIYRVIYG